MKLKAFIIVSFILVVSGLWAITPFKTYSVAEGLPNSTIKAVCQDSLGYIWFGTRNGLVRFDGYEFRTYNYNVQRENIVYSNDITCITKDKHGMLWIGTFNWIVLFDPFTEKYVELNLDYPEDNIPQGVVTNIWIDENENAWIAAKTGLYKIAGNKVKAAEELKGAYINSMNASDADHLMVEVMNKGVALFNIKTDKLEYLADTADRPMIYKIYRDKKGKVWLGADSNHLYQFDADDNSIKKVDIHFTNGTKFGNEQIHDILEYNDSILIVGTDNGLLAFNTHTNEYVPRISNMVETSSLLNHRVMCLYEDNQGGLWVGTFSKGVKYCNPNRYYFNHYDLEINNKLPIGVVGNLSERNGTLWIGHEQGISSMNLLNGKISHIDIQSQLSIPNKKTELFFMYQDGDLLYFYLLNRGLYALNMNNGRIVKNIGIPPTSQVRSMAKDIMGNLWIGEEVLSIYNPETSGINSFLSTNINNITSFMLTQDLLLRENGSMLVGTRTSGVWEYPYDEQNKNRYSVAHQLNFEQLKNKNVNVLFQDSQKNIWIGTYGSGLFRCNFDQKECSQFNTDNGLAHNSICGILEDEANNIWVTTVTGVTKINQQNGKMVNYTQKTGFPLEEVSRKAFLKASDGFFYVGGSNGLASFDPDVFREAQEAPPVTISLIESLNSKDGSEKYRFDTYERLKNISLPFSNSSLVIKFSALNYFFPEGTQYAYKLQGIETEWTITERNEVVYTNLNNGKYTFCVKASNNEGVWSDDMTTIEITILPPFWRTTWAYIIYFLLIAGAAYLIIQFFYHRKTAKYKQQINKIEKENIERYYQMKLELFTKFSHELRTPLTLITGPAEDMLKNEELPEQLAYPTRLIHKNANRLLMLVNQLMDFRKMEHGSMMLNVRQVEINNFLFEQIDNFSQLAKKKDIQFLYTNQYWGKDIWFDMELMEKVIFNLISNAIKHSPKGEKIAINSHEADGNLIISVKDNGEGISKENMEKIFDPFFQVDQGTRSGLFGSGIGLNFAQYVVKLHNGKIWVESTPGQGSEFFVQLPLGVSHFDESQTKILTSNDEKEANELLRKNSLSQIEVDDLPESKPSDNKPLILVAEDDDDLRHYITSQLSEEYSIIEAPDGKEAFALATDKIPDLIISDVMMPIMDGIELCRKVKEDMRTAHIPVILLTAKVRNENIQEGYEALADDYVLKPFDANLLKVRVKNLIENRVQLRKVFSNKLTALDIPTGELTINDQFMEKLIAIIERRAGDSELSINDIATEMGVSRSLFFRKIKAISDVSPQKLILNIRMKMAVDYLKTRQYTIAEVAYKVGFTEPAYFSKTFKGVFNITPSEFLKGE